MKKLLLVLLVASAVATVSYGRNAQQASAKSETIRITAPPAPACEHSTVCDKDRKAECAARCENCPQAQGQPCDGTCGCEKPAVCDKDRKAECAAQCENCPQAQGQPCESACGCEKAAACVGTKTSCEGNAGCQKQKCGTKVVECR